MIFHLQWLYVNWIRVDKKKRETRTIMLKLGILSPSSIPFVALPLLTHC